MILAITEEEFNGVLARLDRLEKRAEEAENSPLALEWVTRKQAAIMLNKTPNTISTMAYAGILEHRKEQRALEIKLDSIREYKKKFHIK